MMPSRQQNSINSSTTTKHVHFGGVADVHSVEKTPREDRNSLWYQSDELHNLFEQDLEKVHSMEDNFSSECQQQQQQHPSHRRHQDSMDSGCMNNDFTARGLEEERGLNLLVDYKNRPIKSYMKDVLGAYQYGKEEYGSADPDMLRSFAVSRSVRDRERAQDLGKHDEQEAYKSYVL